MATDDERREVARRLRKLDYSDFQEGLICSYMNALCIEEYVDGVDIAHRLADLIEPTDGFDLDTVQRVCFECMEGCDEPEWTLYTTIHDAIARYKRGESGPTYDRDALLALARQMETIGSITAVGTVEMKPESFLAIARRIREALGVCDCE